MHSLKKLRGGVLPVLALVVWWWCAHYYPARSALLVPPEQVLHTAWHMAASGQLWRALSASLIRELTGFALGASAGMILGYLLGQWRTFSLIVGGSFNTFKQVSLFAWIPLISVWFGLTDTAKVVFLSLAALVPVTVHTWDGLRQVPPSLQEVARTLCLTRLQTFRTLQLPAALPTIFTGLYLSLIYSWLATIGAEYLLVSGEGIGNLLIDGSEHFRMDLVITGMVIIGLVGWGLNASARWLEQRLAYRLGYQII